MNYLKLVIFAPCLILSACTITPEDTRMAACNKLKSQIVFSGATSDRRQAEIERSQRYIQQRDFDASYCP